VRVPARPDSLQSPGIEADDPEMMRQYKGGNSFSEIFEQTKWIIELETGDGTIGIGETYRATEYADVDAALQSILGADVLALDWRRLPVQEPRVYDGIECAVLDLAGRVLGLPVYQLLGGKAQDTIECSGWAGRRTPEDAARKAREALERGHRVFKFKCSDSDPVRVWCERISETCGTQIQILLDPNQRWRDVETTLRLMEGVPDGIMFGLEDPVERHNYAAYRELRERLQIPIFLHIAVPYRHMGQLPEDIIPALREHCADGFNFNGPMFEFVRLANTAALEGLPCWHGSEVDCGILEAAALHAAAATANCTLPCDIFGELVRVDDLIVEPIHFERGHAIVPNGPGLGVELDHEAKAEYQSGAAIEH
jgi:muconate cycloisomerase